MNLSERIEKLWEKEKILVTSIFFHFRQYFQYSFLTGLLKQAVAWLSHHSPASGTDQDFPAKTLCPHLQQVLFQKYILEETGKKVVIVPEQLYM